MESGTQSSSSLRSKRSPAPTHGRRARREELKIAFRFSPDGTVETIPLTREILLNPSLDVQVPQSPPHDETRPGNVRI